MKKEQRYSRQFCVYIYSQLQMRGSSDSYGTIGSMKSSGSMTDLPAKADNRFSSSSPSPTSFLTPAFTAAAAAGGFFSGNPLNIDAALLRSRQSCLNRLRFSSSSSSNDSSDSNPSAAAARKRLLRVLNLRSFSTSTTRAPSPSLLSPMENRQALPPSARSSSAYPVYKTPVKVEVQEDVLVMDAVSESVHGPGRARHPLKLISSSSSSSSINNYSGGSNSSKTEICRSWEEYGFCCFGSRCQFAHGKEELRGDSRPWKLKPESVKQCSTVGLLDYNNKYLRYASPAVTGWLLPNYEAVASDSAAPQLKRKTASIAPVGHPSPQQEEQRFSWPPTEAQEAVIQQVLYGPSQSCSRLPVFVEICPEPEPRL